MKPKHLSVDVGGQMENSTGGEILSRNRGSNRRCFLPQRGSAPPIQNRIAFKRLPAGGSGERCQLRISGRSMPQTMRLEFCDHLTLVATGVAMYQQFSARGILDGKARLAVLVCRARRHPSGTGFATTESL